METESAASVSVVIPVLNEAGGIDACIDHLLSHDIAEIIVVDGGSVDGTTALVRKRNAVCLLMTERGRGHQMNAGCTHATGDIVLLLHSDTFLPADTIPAVRALMMDERIAGGCFRLAFDRTSPILAASTWASRFETPFTTFGDQAIFVRRGLLEAIGGVPRQPLFEDVALRRAIKRTGHFKKLPLAVTTSARRFCERGALRQQALNTALLIGYLAGIPASWLARFYPAQQPRK